MSADLDVIVTEAWRESFPEARVGLLLVDDVVNMARSAPLEERVRQIESALRARFAGADRATLLQLLAIQAYRQHYARFGQTYHVLRQLESVALKGKPLTSDSALVLAMFAAELQSQLLTAGHDMDALVPPLVLDRSSEGDRFEGIGGREQVLRGDDMLMRDGGGIISAVIYGPDQRTRLRPQTRRALFSTYAPRDISSEVVHAHLDELTGLVRLLAPRAVPRQLGIFP